REAGAVLLDRTARAAELTDAGRRLADHAERILALIEAAEADLSAPGPPGRVTVTAFPPPAVAFRPALVRRVRAHPALAPPRREARREEGLRLVRAGEVDVALVADWSGRLTSADHGSGVLQFYRLIRDPLVLVLPRGHPAADTSREVDLDKLRDEPWLAAPSGEPSRQAVDKLLAGTGGMPPAPWEVEGLSPIPSPVPPGLGIAAPPPPS